MAGPPLGRVGARGELPAVLWASRGAGKFISCRSIFSALNVVREALKKKMLIRYIEVQNQVKYGGHLDFFSSRCFRRLLNT